MPPKFIYDVLIHVIDVSASLATATSLMATCKLLNHQGAKMILQDRIICRWASFLDFLRAEDGTRLPHVRGLDLSDWTYDAPSYMGS